MRVDRWVAGLLAVLICLFVTGRAVSAQGTTSRVAGIVSDTAGARIPGATVTLRNDATGVVFTTVSNETGNYAFESVQVGRYTLSVVDAQGLTETREVAIEFSP